jgi:hypothetical protein
MPKVDFFSYPFQWHQYNSLSISLRAFSSNLKMILRKG